MQRATGRCIRWVTAGLLSAATAIAAAQDFPPRQITLVVAFPAGGGTDFFARLFSQKLAPLLNTTMVVENRPGASGNIGAAAVARAAPTGQMLLFSPSNIAMTPAVYKNPGLDVQRDLAPVSMTAMIPFVLVIHPSLPARSVKELIALAKARPGALDYGSSGLGSPPFFAMELLKFKAGINISHVPYKGAGQILTALLSGEIQCSFLIPPVAMVHMRSGKLRGLGVTTAKRSSILSELPTLREAGVPGYEITQWHGFFAPAKTPAAVISRLHAEIVKVLADSDVKQRLAAEGAEAVGSEPAVFATFLAAEIRNYQDLARRLSLQLE